MRPANTFEVSSTESDSIITVTAVAPINAAKPMFVIMRVATTVFLYGG